jgi:transcriptional regulator with XRE-family HTH domain
VVEIKSLRGQLTQRAIAERFGVEQPQIYRILAGKRWAHVED